MIEFRHDDGDLTWPDDEGPWSDAAHWMLGFSGMEFPSGGTYRIKRHHEQSLIGIEPEDIKWYGLLPDGREIRLTQRHATELRNQLPRHWKAYKYYNGRSLEIGNVRIVRTHAEAIKRRWHDIAEHFTELEPDE